MKHFLESESLTQDEREEFFKLDTMLGSTTLVIIVAIMFLTAIAVAAAL